MSVTPSEEAQIRENERVALQKDKRDVAANVRLCGSLLALLANAGVDSTDAMIQGLEVLGLKVKPEFSQKDISGMRAAIRNEFIPFLNAITQKKANRIGLDVAFFPIVGDQQAIVESSDSAPEPDPEVLKQAIADVRSRHDMSDEALLRNHRIQNRQKGLDFDAFARRLQEPERLAKRRALCDSFQKGGRFLTVVGRNAQGEFKLMEACDEAPPERGDLAFNEKGAAAAGLASHRNILFQLSQEGLLCVTLHDCRTHLAAFPDRGKYSSDWAAPDGKSPEALNEFGFAAYFCRYVGEARDYEIIAHYHYPDRRGRGVLWV